MEFSRSLQSQPDPRLGARDPGRPVLRRLTRLEYNNTIRDLFGLSCDIFAFPERLPIADKNYFLSTEQTLGTSLRTSMREYGQKTDLLLPAAGLPGDNRAEFGFANRGDVMNMSPLLLENYLELSAAISRSERLERESPVMAQLLGVKLQGPPRSIDAAPEPATAPAFMIATTRMCRHRPWAMTAISTISRRHWHSQPNRPGAVCLTFRRLWRTRLCRPREVCSTLRSVRQRFQ